jgi:hypothetical protein
MIVYYKLSKSARQREFVYRGEWPSELIRWEFDPKDMQPEERQDLVDMGLYGGEIFALILEDGIVKISEKDNSNYQSDRLAVLNERLIWPSMFELLLRRYGKSEANDPYQPVPGLEVAV